MEQIQARASFPQKPPLPVPVLPARFRMLEELGRGGMAVVYHAYDTVANRHVAVKFLPRTDNEADKRRFQREAADLATVFHPNVVSFYGVGGSEGQEFIEMEYVGGGNLGQFLRPDISLRSIIEVFLGVCAGLEHIHNRGLVHRDLKPANVLISSDGVPKIADLGLARRMEGYGESNPLTQDGMILGTMAYMSPEQLMSSEVGPSTDLYALGISLFQAVTGQHPFQTDNHHILLQSHLNVVPRSPIELRSDLPVRLATTILGLLEKLPAKRPRSAAVVATALQRCLEDLSIRNDAPVQTSLQGRGQDLEALAQHCAQGAGLLMVAPSEVGRSRLLEELSSHLGARGVSVYLLTPGVDLAKIFAALGAPSDEVTRLFLAGGHSLVAGGLRRRLQEASSVDSKTFLGTISGIAPNLASPKGHERVRKQPTILLCDDLERLDPFTQSVLEKLMHLTPPERSGWIISITQAQAFDLPDHAQRYELAPLRDPGIQALAEIALKGQLSPELSAWLLPRAGGSPRRLKLLVAALRADDLLDRSSGTIRLSDPSGPTNSVIDSLLAEVERQDEETRTMLRTAALLREPFGFTAVAQASGLSEERADKILENLVHLGLIEETGEFFRISSPQVRRRLATDLSDRVRPRFHARIAEAVKEVDERGRHLALAGQTEEAARLLSGAAQQAHDRGLYVESCSLWEASANCVDSVTAAVGKARSLAAAGHPKEALDSLFPFSAAGDPQVQLCLAELQLQLGAYEDAYSLCKSITALNVEEVLATIYEHQGNLEAACQSLTRALAESPAEANALRERLARLQMRLGQNVEALRFAQLNLEHAKTPAEKLRGLELLAEIERKPKRLTEALALTEQAGWPDESARVEMLRADMAQADGDLTRALGLWQRAVELLRPFGESPALVQALTRLGQTHQAVSRPFAEGALRESVQIGDVTGDSESRALARHRLGVFLLENRELQPAAQNLEEAVELGQDPANRSDALAELSLCYRLLGRDDDSVTAAERSVTDARLVAADTTPLGKSLIALGEASINRKKWKTGLESLQEAQKLIQAENKLYPRLLEALVQLNAEGSQQEYPGLSAEEAERFRRMAHGLPERGKEVAFEPAQQESRPSAPPVVLAAPTVIKSRSRLAVPLAALALLSLTVVGWFSLPAKPGHLLIESQPAGATVDVDGKQGKTPFTVDLPAGGYSVALQLDGYKPYSEKVSLAAGQTSKLVPQLVAATGTLNLSSVPPGASVYIDGKMSGTTPYVSPELPPGKKIQIKMSKAGYVTSTGQVAVVPDSETALSLTLPKLVVPKAAPPPPPKPVVVRAPAPVAQAAPPVYHAPRQRQPVYHSPRPQYHRSAGRVHHDRSLDSIIHRMAQGR